MMGKKQYAALPFPIQQSGLRIMLITTRRKGRWSVSKGSQINNEKPRRTAAVEAYEEAGLIGSVKKARVGKFRHRRRRGATHQLRSIWLSDGGERAGKVVAGEGREECDLGFA